MKYWSFVIFIFSLLISAAVIGQSENGLTENQKLKAENFKLKSQLLQCQVSIGNNQLTQEQNQLVNEFRRSLGAKDEEVFDWNTLTFTATKSTK